MARVNQHIRLELVIHDAQLQIYSFRPNKQPLSQNIKTQNTTLVKKMYWRAFIEANLIFSNVSQHYFFYGIPH